MKKKLPISKSDNVKTTQADRRPIFALAIATCLGVGYLPVAPGTWGSAAAIVLVWGTAAVTRSEPGPMIVVAEFTLPLALAAIGLWASELVVEAGPSNPDPGYVVIDELSGQTISLVLGVALSAWTTTQLQQPLIGKVTTVLSAGLLNWKYLIAGFILFRVFDIWKPFPAGRAELLPGGLGIMADDWVAGGYAALGLWFLRALRF